MKGLWVVCVIVSMCLCVLITAALAIAAHDGHVSWWLLAAVWGWVWTHAIAVQIRKEN